MSYGALLVVFGPNSGRSGLIHYIQNQKDLCSKSTKCLSGYWDPTFSRALVTLGSNAVTKYQMQQLALGFYCPSKETQS